MRRLARHLFTLCSAASLLLCVAVCVLWVRSHSAFDHLWYRHRLSQSPQQRTEEALHLVSVRGQLLLVASHDEYGEFRRRLRPVERPGCRFAAWSSGYREGWANEEHSSYVQFRGSTLRRVLGLGVAHPWSMTNHGGPTRHFDMAGVPHWGAALVLALPALLPAWRRYLRWRSSGRGLCTTCGYDLRASPERCPECGTLTAA
jgi:hypothetical protein